MDTNNNQEKKALGVVLCGGESRRMGTDKGLICQDGIIWAEIVYTHLREICGKAVISLQSRQADKYYNAINHPVKDFVFDRIRISGPLAGILSVHEKYPDKDLFVLACDMVNIDQSLLKDLWDEYHQDNGLGKECSFNNREKFSGYLYTHGGLLEPLCAIYRHNWLSIVYDAIMSGRETEYQVKYYYKFGKFYFQEIDREKETSKLMSLTNMNTPEDINIFFEKRKDE